MVDFQVEDDFNGGALGQQLIGANYTHPYGKYTAYPAGVVPNVAIDSIGQIQGLGIAEFVPGRNGGKAWSPRVPPTSWSQIETNTFLPGYDNWADQDWGPDPLTGELVVEGWFKITGGYRGFSLMSLRLFDLTSAVDEDYGVDGIFTEYDTDLYGMNFFYVNNSQGSYPGNLQLCHRPADWLGPNGWNNVFSYEYGQVPLDTWAHCELRYSPEGVVQCTVTNEGGDLLMDTGPIQGAPGWTPGTVKMNAPYDPPISAWFGTYPASFFTWDYYKITIAGAPPVIVGRPDLVRRRFNT